MIPELQRIVGTCQFRVPWFGYSVWLFIAYIYCIICKLNNNVLIGAQCDSVVVIHGKRLQSIGFVTSILPYIFFTWWVNNDMNNKVSQKLEIIGFKESVKKYTTIYFFLYLFSLLHLCSTGLFG